MREIVQTLVIAILLVILCDLPLPAGLARYTHPIAGCARFAGGHVSVLPAVRFLYQYAVDVRVGAAIGLVVDDAIVVVEGVQRTLRRVWLRKDAARKAMEELTSPVIGIAVVLRQCLYPRP